MIFNEDDLPSNLTTSSSLNAILDSLQVHDLGDFSLLKEFEVQDAFVSSISAVAHHFSDAPASYDKARARDDWPSWDAANRLELQMMEDLGVWDIVPFRPGMEVLGC